MSPVVAPTYSPAGGPAVGAKTRPAEHAAVGDADIDADGVKCAQIELRRERRVLGKTALHRLMAEDNEADAWVELAGQHAHLRP
jgi:hypothetical protein